MTTTTVEKLNSFTMDELRAYADEVISEKYLPNCWEWETQATQLATAVCKLVYKYYNDGDEYGKIVWNDMSSYANWIENHCFPLPALKGDYERNLRFILINAIIMIDSLKDKAKVGSIYNEKGAWDVVEDENWEDEEDLY